MFINFKNNQSKVAIQASISKRFPSMTSSVFARYDKVSKTLPYLVATVATIKKVAIVPASRYVAKKIVAGWKHLKQDPKSAARDAANATGQSMRTAVDACGQGLRKKIMLLTVPAKVAERIDLEATARTAADGSGGSSRPPWRPRRVKASIIPSNCPSVPAAESIDGAGAQAVNARIELCVCCCC